MERQRPEEARARYWRQVKDLAEEHEVPVSEARAMWRRFYKKGGIKRLMLSLTTRASSPTTCPFCRDELPVFNDHEHACSSCGTYDHPEYDPDYPCAPEPVWTCPSCTTKLHQECYDELGTCTTLGCAGRRPRRPRVTARRRNGVDPITGETTEGRTNMAVIGIGIALAVLVALAISAALWIWF